MSQPRVVLIFILCLLTACSAPTAETAPPLQTAAPPAAPFRGIAFVDQTASMREARIGRITPASFAPIYERLMTSGGEFGLGLIRDRSDGPLARLYVPAPPAPPTASTVRAKNIFDAAALRKREDAAQADYKARLRTWHSEAAARVSVFRSTIGPLLDANADARLTDIRSALLRAEVFLAEPTSFRAAAASVILLVTDGVETVNPSESPHLAVAARVLLVNGTGNLGCLGELHPIRFEGLDAAVRFAVEEGDRHERR
jgi:hypothetical protein